MARKSQTLTGSTGPTCLALTALLASLLENNKQVVHLENASI
jgi:hypothetical protein